ncbi:MAG: sugar-binding protein [Candidatus Brocadiia bacterium]
MRHALALATVLLAATAWAADDYTIKVYPCPRLKSAPEIDGKLGDACWQEAPLVSGFTYYNKPALLEVQTSFRVGYDAQCLYFGVHCDEPNAEKLVPRHAGRDSGGVFRGETIEVFLDPRHSQEDYFQLAVNLAGSLYDAHKHDAYWNGAARRATRVVEGGWELELAVPWSDLGVEPRRGMVVGFNVCRDRYAGGSREWSNWAQTAANFHDPIRFAHLVLEPTEEELGELAGEFRKGDRRGPIIVYAPHGYASKAYLAMAREALAGLEKRLAALQAEAEKELAAGAGQELRRCLEEARELVRPFRRRLEDAEPLDAAEWTRLSVQMSDVEARLGTLIWEARLTALLKQL